MVRGKYNTFKENYISGHKGIPAFNTVRRNWRYFPVKQFNSTIT